MKSTKKKSTKRYAPLEMQPGEFRKAGHVAVDRIADFLSTIAQKPVSPNKTPTEIRKVIGGKGLPKKGTNPLKLVRETADLLVENSLFNGHPRFWGYISSSAAPIGALGDFLASSVNPNVGSFQLSPVATEIESQTIRWIAELIGYSTDCGGILVSGGNMANFVCFVAARKAMLQWNVREKGVAPPGTARLRVYTSSETHTWIQKAADLFGLGTDSIRWVPTDKELRMDPVALRKQIREDAGNGDIPLMVIGTAGSVGTGAIDPLPELASLCREYKLWFHVDGAYGALAAVLPDVHPDLKGLKEADSVAVDPHKWLYSPMEAGCALVRNSQSLLDAFTYHPPYYTFGGEGEDTPTNYYERGPQNSRGFRALKVWLGLKQVGLAGYQRMIADDVRLARLLFQEVQLRPELEAFTNGLSITTFRYVPEDLRGKGEKAESYLNQLNTELLARMQNSGEAFCSSTLINGKFVLRVCVVNFRTTVADIRALPEIILRYGEKADKDLRHKLSLPQDSD